MEYRKIGPLSVSLVGLGCNNFGWRIDEGTSRSVIHAALDAGITHFDTATAYGNGVSEETLGKVLGPHRRDVVITSKCGRSAPPGVAPGSKAFIAEEIERTLSRLGSDYVDLYLIHHPDPSTPIAETLEALQGLVRQGKVREIGCSNFNAAQVREATSAAAESGGPSFVNLQDKYNLLERAVEEAEIPLCRELGMSFVPFTPLASGLLTGKYGPSKPAPEGSRLAEETGLASVLLQEQRLEAVDRLDRWATEREWSLVEVALSWVASSPDVASVIAGATSPAQLKTNVSATTAWQMSAAERDEAALVAAGGPIE